MKKKFLSIIAAMICAVILFVAIGCGPEPEQLPETPDLEGYSYIPYDNVSGSINITYVKGGYSQDWINHIIAGFKKQYPGITKVNATAKEEKNLLAGMQAELQQNSGADIYISHGIQWQSFADKGFLANLDDLYAKPVYESKTFADRIISDALTKSKINGSYYKVPFIQGAGGIIINEKLFEDNNWPIPEDYDDLKDLCAKIVNDKVPGSNTGGNVNVAPFTWAGNEEEWKWDYLVFEWWAQLAGIDKVIEQQKLLSADSYKSAASGDLYYEFMEAYGYWYDLMVSNPYSTSNCQTKTKMASQGDFLRGDAAMMVSGHWEFNEISKTNPNMRVRMIDTPFVPGAKTDSDGNPIKVAYNVGDDNLVINKNSRNLNAAKAFAHYLARYASSTIFTREAKGPMLAFKYDVDGIVKDTSTFTESSFSKSIRNKLTVSQTFDMDSQTPIKWRNTSTAVLPWPMNQYYYTEAFKNPTQNTKTQVGGKVYTTASSNWSSWMANVPNN